MLVRRLAKLAEQLSVSGFESDVALEVYADGSGVVSHVVKNNGHNIGTVSELFAWRDHDELNAELFKWVSSRRKVFC